MIPDTNTSNSKTRWYGNDDFRTRTRSMFYHPHHDPQGLSKETFETIVNEIARLTSVLDGNQYRVVEIVALRRAKHVCFIAYRYTSDWAMWKYESDLMELGGAGLGRGGFDPWAKDSGDYDHFLSDEPTAETPSTS